MRTDKKKVYYSVSLLEPALCLFRRNIKSVEFCKLGANFNAGFVKSLSNIFLCILFNVFLTLSNLR